MYLTLNSVNKRFDGANNRGRHQKETLKDISFEAAQGEFLCIVGPSGCGKSTLLNLVAGLVRPTSGEIVLDGKKITGPGAERAVMFQEAALYPWLNVIENIIFGLQATGCPKARQKEIAERYLKMVRLWNYREYPIHQISGGMKQRAALARALAMDSKLLLMDEPFGALDAVTRTRLQDLVLELWAQEEPKKTVFFVTHDVDEAMLLANRILVLGQSPSNVIYDCKIPEDQKVTRENQFESMDVLKMRNELIRQINQDVLSHVE